MARSSAPARHNPALLSVIVPVYNEEDTLPSFFARLKAVLQSLPGVVGEVIFVDDGSRDSSPAILQRLHDDHPVPAIKIVRLSRNFGALNALLAGVHAASGDAVVWLAADLQDPPELLGRLVPHWQGGADVVWAVRTGRDDPWHRRVLATLFYRVLRRVAVPEYPPMGVDVCLMDRRVARLFGALREHHRFTQALIMKMGFAQVAVPYAREHRHAGRSKWGTAPRLIAMATDMIVAFSSAPLRLMLYAGMTLALAGAVGGVTALVMRVAYGVAVPGWLPPTLAVLMVGGLQAAFLGILGEYVWRILEEVRDRPHYIVAERVGFEGDGGKAVADQRVAAQPTPRR